MSFLKKFGQITARSLAAVTGFGPLFRATVPQSIGVIDRVENDLLAVAGVVSEVETIGEALSLEGPQKLTAAAPLVSQIILRSVASDRKIKNRELFQQGVEKISGGMADILSSLEDKVEAESRH